MRHMFCQFDSAIVIKDFNHVSLYFHVSLSAFLFAFLENLFFITRLKVIKKKTFVAFRDDLRLGGKKTVSKIKRSRSNTGHCLRPIHFDLTFRAPPHVVSVERPWQRPSMPAHNRYFHSPLLIHFSDANERPETENGTIYSHDSGFEGECCSTLPASPTTIPRIRMGSTSRRDRPRRQRTTSTSQNTIRPNEAIIRVSNNRTIYTAGN